jgi:hypothetical protein
LSDYYSSFTSILPHNKHTTEKFLISTLYSSWSEHNATTKAEGDAATLQTHNGPSQTKQNGCPLLPAITLGDENQNGGDSDQKVTTTTAAANKRSSLLADEEDLIPLIDIQSSSEDIPEMISFPARRQNSTSQRQVCRDSSRFSQVAFLKEHGDITV